MLLVDATTSSNPWLVGKVTKTFPDKAGLARTVQVQTRTNVIVTKPVTKRCVLVENEP